MFTFDDSTAVAVKPAKPASAGGGKAWFTDGDVLIGEQPTVVRAWHLNMMTSELLSVLTAAGVAPDRNNDSQLGAAIQGMIAAAINALVNAAPGALDTLKELADALGNDAAFATTVTNALGALNGKVFLPGFIAISASPVEPAGWWFCDGTARSRTGDAALFAAIGTYWGAGDGSTTFNVPDLRGEFLRGWDNGRGIDAGRALGSWQADELRAHNHELLSDLEGVSGPLGTAGPDALFNQAADSLGFTENAGGAETRPRNAAVNFIIKR